MSLQQTQRQAAHRRRESAPHFGFSEKQQRQAPPRAAPRPRPDSLSAYIEQQLRVLEEARKQGAANEEYEAAARAHRASLKLREALPRVEELEERKRYARRRRKLTGPN